MRIRTIGLVVAAAVLAAACSPAPGSPEWCKGIVDGSVKTTPDEVIKNMESCAKHELAG